MPVVVDRGDEAGHVIGVRQILGGIGAGGDALGRQPIVLVEGAGERQPVTVGEREKINAIRSYKPSGYFCFSFSMTSRANSVHPISRLT